ncbi:hydrogenase expression/formation protein HypE [Thermogladius sp. 4427co]|uniref:hydrogenase expression/formation protein HypE n=1 Tax=Thermogladius sp. 4427co TaxID=3450718 RepID=UPI003F794165
MRSIEILHGAGGLDTLEIVMKLVVSRVPEKLRKALGGGGLDVLDDGSYVRIGDQYLVFTSDTYTVNPFFFPGGDIGHLAASGVLNDLVMMGATPVAFMDNILVEEGFEISVLDKIVASMIRVLEENNVALIGGDFKVMPKGSLDKIAISGFGIGYTSQPPIVDEPRPGDKIVVTGNIAEHGATILAAQLGLLEENTSLRSDSRPLVKTVLPVIQKYRPYVNAARDPTRGGLAGVLNEWVHGKNISIIIDRTSIPIREEVRDFLDAMGVDPLNVASEGIAVLSVRPEVVDEVVRELVALGEVNARVVGEVIEGGDFKGRVLARTEIGGLVVVPSNPLNLPRIC